MSEYQPGTVAIATVRGVKGVRVLRRSDTHGGPLDWAHCADGVGYSCTRDFDVTDIHPLVVLDLDNPQEVAHLLRNSATGDTLRDLADQIEAQTKPPKPAEPTGLGAVVEDGQGDRWVRIRDGYWLSDGGSCLWVNLDAVRVLSEGVES